MDDECLYVHDPDPTEGEQSALDCQYLPILRRDFDRMSVFGRNQLRTAVIVRKKPEKERGPVHVSVSNVSVPCS
jgi:hypothetical protein